MRRHATTLFAKDGVQYVTNTARMIRELASEGVLTLDEHASSLSLPLYSVPVSLLLAMNCM